MKIDATYELHAPRERVYAALVEPEILRRAIPGCESLEKIGDNTFTAILKAGVGSIKGTFKGEVRLEDCPRAAPVRPVPALPISIWIKITAEP